MRSRKCSNHNSEETLLRIINYRQNYTRKPIRQVNLAGIIVIDFEVNFVNFIFHIN
jgi:hypothetical protein